MNWIKSTDKIKPQKGRVVLCYCPGWNDLGYQVGVWDGHGFCYEEQPNEMFSDYVESWAIFTEAD